MKKTIKFKTFTDDVDDSTRGFYTLIWFIFLGMAMFSWNALVVWIVLNIVPGMIEIETKKD